MVVHLPNLRLSSNANQKHVQMGSGYFAFLFLLRHIMVNFIVSSTDKPYSSIKNNFDNRPTNGKLTINQTYVILLCLCKRKRKSQGWPSILSQIACEGNTLETQISTIFIARLNRTEKVSY